MELTNPTVTAIITTFNRSHYCKAAIESVLAQTYKDFELIVLDNSSKDDTEAVVHSFTDPRIRYFKHPQLNIAQARNLGVKEAKGNYVAFLDDDDRWLPNKLAEEVQLFVHGEETLGLTYGGFVKINKEGKEIGYHTPILSGSILKELIEQKDDFTGSASNPMLKRSVIEALGGYDERVVTGEDFELYLRLAKKYTISFTTAVVLQIRQHPGPRLGDKLKEAALLEVSVMEQFPEVFANDKKLRSFYYQKIGGKFCRIGDSNSGRSYLGKALEANPLNIKAYVQYLLSFVNSEWYRKVHGLYIKYAKGW